MWLNETSHFSVYFDKSARKEETCTCYLMIFVIETVSVLLLNHVQFCSVFTTIESV